MGCSSLLAMDSLQSEPLRSTQSPSRNSFDGGSFDESGEGRPLGSIGRFEPPGDETLIVGVTNDVYAYFLRLRCPFCIDIDPRHPCRVPLLHLHDLAFGRGTACNSENSLCIWPVHMILYLSPRLSGVGAQSAVTHGKKPIC